MSGETKQQEQPDIRLLTEYLSEYKQNIYHSLAKISLGSCFLNAALPIIAITSSLFWN